MLTAYRSGDPTGRGQLVEKHVSIPFLLVVLLVLTAADSVLVAQELWEARYNGPGNGDDGATAIAVDDSGNVYVTGYSAITDTSSVFATVKYDSSGDTLWARHYNGLGNSDNGATAIAVDASGNVYVTGYSATSDTSSAYATVKYDSSGVELWVRRFSNLVNGEDGATAIAVDDSGNVYVTGYSTGSGTGLDYATIKYHSSGVEQWNRRYSGTGNHEDGATAIAVDNWGNVYVTGYSFDSDTSSAYATVKYDSSGMEQWVRRYNVLGTVSGATAIAVDDSGNAYVTGYSFDSDTSSTYATIKYDSSGQQQWLARYSGPGNREDGATAIAVDTSGNVYVTGYSLDSDTSSAYATIKYDSSGVEQWVARFNGPGNGDNGATGIAVDDSGNVCVTGYSIEPGTDLDYATIKYDTSGQEQWVARYNGPGNREDAATAIAVDNSGNVYVTGNSAGSGKRTDYATVKYNTSGTGMGRPLERAKR